MKNILGKATIFTMCVVTGIFLSIQLRQNNEWNQLVTLSSIEDMKNEISNTQNQISNIEKIIEKKRKELKNIKSAVNEGNISEVLEKELKKVRKIAGYEDLQGPGVIIKIADNNERYIVGQEAADDIVHDRDILNILNDLKMAGAEAISIKGQRVLLNSEIQCGGPIIRINGRSLTNPFIIHAIGDPKLLYAAVNAPNTTGYILKNLYKLEIKTQPSDNIIIRKHKGDLNLKYLKPVKEGE
ncbi:MAG: DUF881 domain-containing protein [Firmicutes bacterium]|nr:DUF881 domain-containing protein [Bacillota bacterium]